MANLNTYARLIKPKMFRPDEPVTFRLEYSENLTGYATLIIDGYQLTVPSIEKTYTGTEQTQYMNTAVSGQRYEDFVIEPNTLGHNPVYVEGGDPFLWTNIGRMKAHVECGEGEDKFISNTILVDMLMSVDDESHRYNSFDFVDKSYSVSSSTATVSLKYGSTYCLGTIGNDQINSYRIFLYDSNKNLIRDSSELYDWSTDAYYNVYYDFDELLDNTLYYTKATAVTIGGYVFETDYIPINVKYEIKPILSPNINISNLVNKGCVKLDIDFKNTAHTKAIVSRSVINTNRWMEVKSSNTSENKLIVCDYYALPNTEYLYKVEVFNGDNLIDIYYSSIIHKFNGIAISDIMGSYCTIAEENGYPINRNDRGETINTMDNKFPYTIINGLSNYETGTVTGIFAPYKNECDVDLSDNTLYTKQFREWLNNGKAKLLKYNNGESWIVSVSNVSTNNDKDNKKLTTSFNWTQIGNSKDIKSYSTIGLVVDE